MGKQSPFREFLFIIWIMTLVFLSACGEGYALGTPATPTPIQTCGYPEIQNPYISHSIDEVTGLYQYYLENQADSGKAIDARREAFLRLVELVRFESATNVLSRNNIDTARATVTLLDPAIVQYVILNQFLYNISTNHWTVAMDDQEYGSAAFRTRIQSAMQDVASRQELLFMITVTALQYDTNVFGEEDFSVKIPFEQMRLINASDQFVYSSHDDHNLNVPMNSNSESSSGLIGFPLGWRSPNGCIEILDQWNTSLTVEVADIEVGGKKIDSIMWTVPYYPLIHDDFIHHGQPFYHMDKYISVDPLQITSLATPPTSVGSFNSAINPDEYWWKTSQYIWYLIISLSHD